MVSPNEDIIQANAAELGHLVNQLTLSRDQCDLLSQFLIKKDDTAFGYNIKLKQCVSWLKNIPFSEEFVKRLVYLEEPPELWERHSPIEHTPKTHIIHAAYQRILKRTMFNSRDPHFGAALPSIFYRETNILTNKTIYTVDLPDRLYEICRPFGYDFPDYIEADDMIFRCIELWNPHYVKLSTFNSKYRGRPTPININGKYVEPCSNKIYTVLYRRYIRSLLRA